MLIVSFTPKIPEDYNTLCSTSGSNKQNLRDRILDLSSFFRYKHIASFNIHLSFAQGESLPGLFRGNFCSRVCFDLLVEKTSVACSH